MKSARSVRVTSVLWMLALTVGVSVLGIVSTCCADTVEVTPYTITGIGFYSTATESRAYGLNDAGQVVGYSRVSGSIEYATIWENGVLTELPPPTGYTKGRGLAVNSSGDVVLGMYRPDDKGPCIWKKSGSTWEVTNLIPTFSGKEWAVRDMNEDGLVVMVQDWTQMSPGDSGFHLMLWDSVAETPPEDLGMLRSYVSTRPGATGAPAKGVSINNEGQIAGESDGYAFLWEDGVFSIREPLPGYEWSTALNINDLGEIVGWSNYPGGDQAVKWASDGTVQALGTLDASGYSRAWAINNSGVIVGQADARAFVYIPDVGMLDLKQLLAPGSPAWSLLEFAVEINNNGQIVGWGLNPDGKKEGFVLTPATGQTIIVTKPEPVVWTGEPYTPPSVTITNNLLANPDFETGDLTGWTEGTIANYPLRGTNESPAANVFDSANPFEYYYRSGGLWYGGDIFGPPPSSKDGYSAGWGMTGTGTDSWVAQRFNVAPGRYAARAKWDAIADINPGWPQTRSVAMRTSILTDANVDQFNPSVTSMSQLRHWYSRNEWIPGAFEAEVETYGGVVEVRFGLRNESGDIRFQWIAYDNCEFELELLEEYIPATSIDEAKTLPDKYPADVTGAIVTSQIYNDTGTQIGFTVETPDRSSGIRIATTTATPFVGDAVDIEGQLATVSGERIINATSATTTGYPGSPAAFSIAGIDTGGGAYGVQGAVVNDAASDKYAVGMNNVGILMKIVGKVTAVVEADPMTPSFNDCFYVDDAYGDAIAGFETGLKDGSGNIGIMCRRPAGMFGSPGTVPSVGDYVDVVGVMGVQQIGGKNARFMWTKGWTAASFDTFNRNHVAKWSLLSLPAQPNFADPAVLFGDADKIDGRLYRWDAPTQSLGMYDMWAPDLFGAMNSSEGYWLNAAAAGTISYTGYTESPALDRWISAPNGWKLMGNPFTSNTQWVDWKATDGTAMKSIYGASQYGSGWMQSIGYWWNDATQSLSDLGLADDFPQSEELKTWYGYWVKTGKHLGLVAPH